MLKKLNFIFLILINLNFLFSKDSPKPKDKQESFDVIIALDKSSSMKGKFEGVKKYINEEIIDKQLKSGDYLLVVAFFGKTTIPVSTTINDDTQKSEIKNIINNLTADGQYTDIGNALDALKIELDKQPDKTRKKTLLMITDGKHDPPPFSKYSSQQKFANHEFFINKKEVAMGEKGDWKIIYLDLGGKSDTSLVEKFSQFHVSTDEKGNVDMETVPSLKGRIKITGEVKVKPVGLDGKSKIIIPIKTEHFDNTILFSIEDFNFETLIKINIDVIESPYVVKLSGEESIELNIPVKFSGDLVPGMYKDRLNVTFKSAEHFDPQDPNLQVYVKVNNLIENLLWLLIIILVIVLALLGLGIYYLMVYLTTPKVKFRISSNEADLNDKSFTVIQGKPLYLVENNGKMDISKERPRTISARISCAGKNLRFSVIDNNKVPKWKDLPKNIFDFKIIIKNQNNQEGYVTFHKL